MLKIPATDSTIKLPTADEIKKLTKKAINIINTEIDEYTYITSLFDIPKALSVPQFFLFLDTWEIIR